MASMTVLEIVQDILSDMDGDEVNSINDTLESLQVAQIVKSTFDSIVISKDWPRNRKIKQLVASGNTARPTHMTLPSNCSKVVEINYNKKALTGTKDIFSEVTYKEPDDFLRLVNLRNSAATEILSVTDTSGITLNIYNDRPPKYYTSFDDQTIIMDAYDSEVDDTLKAAKTQVICYIIPTLTLADTSVPDIAVEMFPYLVEEAKSRAASRIGDAPDAAAESESNSQRRRMSRNAWVINKGDRYPNYGRK
jgi:hypothetical protein